MDVVSATEYDRETEQLVDVEQVVTIWGTQNFGKQEMSGLEMEFDWIPYEGGRLSGWATFMETEIVDDYVPNGITVWTHNLVDLVDTASRLLMFLRMLST